MTQTFAVIMTGSAERDIETIYDYICGHGSPDIAANLLQKFLDRIDSLTQFPRRGTRVAEFEGTQEARQFLIGVYRGIYVIEGDTVLIVGVFDGRRNVRTLLERRIFYGSD